MSDPTEADRKAARKILGRIDMQPPGRGYDPIEGDIALAIHEARKEERKKVRELIVNQDKFTEKCIVETRVPLGSPIRKELDAQREAYAQILLIMDVES